MTKIEVSDEDVEAVEKITGWQWPDFGQVRMSVAKEIIAAAYEVMRKKHQDDLAEAVKEALGDEQGCLVAFSKRGVGTEAVVSVSSPSRHQSLCRSVSADDNFATLAAAAVRQLAAQVKQ